VDGRLRCDAGHDVPVERGVPIFTREVRREATPSNMAPLPAQRSPGAVDPFVDDWIVNTNGNLYWSLRGRMPRYPIPDWPAKNAGGPGQTLIDIGCGWGRWTIAGARAGYEAWGVDVHLDALWAAGRVVRAVGAEATFACCEAARLPFKTGSADFVFSYSVLQHLEKKTARSVLMEIARILRPGGTCFVQLPNAYGLVSLLRQAKRGFREGRPGTFEMRYWTRRSIRNALEEAGLGNIRFRAEGFLLQNTQRNDVDLLSGSGAAAVRFSCFLRDAADRMPLLSSVADSFWIEAKKQ
jgi:SAM-dependent methyltransferase